ncbi:hypothetical protein [Rhizobium aegyptiacum]|uniref:hypothetical protein n=1 Tax=Rhizobium aegyptiacum TaxID=1764550 RepID=UPI0012E7AC55|nr:hypothetical protein [Rhizobium aegyptiacum]
MIERTTAFAGLQSAVLFIVIAVEIVASIIKAEHSATFARALKPAAMPSAKPNLSRYPTTRSLFSHA